MSKIWWLALLGVSTVYAGEPVRLSDYLAHQSQTNTPYLLGLMWTTPEEKVRQESEFKALQNELVRLSKQGRMNLHDFDGLMRALSELTPTGRVRVSAANRQWLEANPKKNPLLLHQDEVWVGERPEVIRVMLDNGAVCEVRHREGLRTHDYIHACVEGAKGAFAWLVQPDGRVQKIGLQAWSALDDVQPAPGAWLWAPQNAKLEDSFNLRWASWLATQGVSVRVQEGSFSSFYRQIAPPVPEVTRLDVPGRSLVVQPTSNTWGNVGLLQTPTARMRDAGYFGLGVHKDSPYTNVNIFLQPLKDLEVGFRYVNVAYRKYGSYELSGDQEYKDKSTDLKLRVVDESTWVPELAVGLRDLTGTGLFSSEYVVANKRYGRLDFSAGLGWGYLGGRGNVANPMSKVFGPQYNTRVKEVGLGGNFAAKSWFRGPAAYFGGVEYQSPWNLTFKAEYDGNNYRREPFGKTLEVKSPINWGIVYTGWRGVEVSAGYERGNTWSAGLTLYTDFVTLSTPKTTDRPVPAVSNLRPNAEPNWAQTAEDIERLTDWLVKQIYQEKDRVVVKAERSANPTPQVRLDKALAVLHRDAPSSVDKLEIQHVATGSALAAQAVTRDEWVSSQNQPARTMKPYVPEQPSYEIQEPNVPPLLARVSKPYYIEPGLDFIQNIGGPDGFVLYQFSATLNAGLKLPGDVQVKGLMRERLANNYDKFKYDAPSNLPRVRTNLRSYYTTSRTTLSNLTVSKTQRLADNWYGAVYAGYFEEMFGGVGSEVLYRKPGSRWAVGLDVNQVKQRNFAQDFGFQDYKVNTGHLTAYWMTPFEGVHTSLAMGQYLVGDRGATLSVTKTFSNGSSMGTYVTKTNLSAQQFGEGSYDKGIFWSIPFDALLTSSSRFNAGFMWQPLIRDGGARVVRPVSLFYETFWLAPDANTRMPAVPSNHRLIPDDYVEPYARVR